MLSYLSTAEGNQAAEARQLSRWETVLCSCGDGGFVMKARNPECYRDEAWNLTPGHAFFSYAGCEGRNPSKGTLLIEVEFCSIVGFPSQFFVRILTIRIGNPEWKRLKFAWNLLIQIRTSLSRVGLINPSIRIGCNATKVHENGFIRIKLNL